MSNVHAFLRQLLGDPSQGRFAEFSRARQAWETLGCAATAGALSGFLLGTQMWLYLTSAGIASVAGIPAAAQHRTLRAAVARTTAGGFAWSASVLGVFLAIGNEATSRVPDPIGWHLVLATLPATAVGFVVWTVADRLSRSPALPARRPSRTGSSHRPVGPLPAQVVAAPRG